jgi:DnaA family protein
MQQMPLPLAGDATPSFDNFLPGANQVAVQHLRDLAMPGAPVYLWGTSGSGKSHLLAALRQLVQQRGQRAVVFDPRGDNPLQPDWTLALIDDCEQLDASAQAEAFRLFVEAANHGVQIVAAGAVPPVDLPVREDLRTRLGWGPVFQLQPLTEEQTRAVLRREADRRGVFLSDEVMDYLLTRFARDLQHLMQLLARLDHFAMSRSRAITVPLIRQMLDEEPAA